MNIFVTSIDPKQSAINLDDKRLRHMPYEYFELMAIWYFRNVENIWLVPFPFWNESTRGIEPHISQLLYHPLSKWLSTDISNLRWLFDHTIHIFDEYQYRFDKEHDLLATFNEQISPFIYPEVKGIYPTTGPFRNSSLFKDEKDLVTAYQMTMVNKWFVTDAIKPTFTKRSFPEWIHNYTVQNKLVK